MSSDAMFEKANRKVKVQQYLGKNRTDNCRKLHFNFYIWIFFFYRNIYFYNLCFPNTANTVDNEYSMKYLKVFHIIIEVTDAQFEIQWFFRFLIYCFSSTSCLMIHSNQVLRTYLIKSLKYSIYRIFINKK